MIALVRKHQGWKQLANRKGKPFWFSRRSVTQPANRVGAPPGNRNALKASNFTQYPRRTTLTLTLSRRERGPDFSLSLRERAGVRVPWVRRSQGRARTGG